MHNGLTYLPRFGPFRKRSLLIQLYAPEPRPSAPQSYTLRYPSIEDTAD